MEDRRLRLVTWDDAAGAATIPILLRFTEVDECNDDGTGLSAAASSGTLEDEVLLDSGVGVGVRLVLLLAGDVEPSR